MSFRNWFDYADRATPFRLFDQHFGANLTEDDLLPGYGVAYPSYSSQIRPRRFRTRQETGISEIRSDKKNFNVMLDVQQFQPHELSVKVVDNIIVIEGKHEERPDEHGSVSRNFTRKYNLPDDVWPDSVKSDLSSDGVLTISAQRVDKTNKGNERPININLTGEPAIVKAPSSPQPQAEKTEKTEKTSNGGEEKNIKINQI